MRLLCGSLLWKGVPETEEQKPRGPEIYDLQVEPYCMGPQLLDWEEDDWSYREDL